MTTEAMTTDTQHAEEPTFTIYAVTMFWGETREVDNHAFATEAAADIAAERIARREYRAATGADMPPWDGNTEKYLTAGGYAMDTVRDVLSKDFRIEIEECTITRSQILELAGLLTA